MSMAFSVQPFANKATVASGLANQPDLIPYTVSTEAAGFPVTNLTIYDDPGRQWRTSTTASAQFVEFNINGMWSFQGTSPLEGAYVGTVNYPAVIFKKRAAAGATAKELCSPNILLWSERLAATDNGPPSSPWQNFGTPATVSINLAGGPYPSRPYQLVQNLGIGNSIVQEVDLLTSSVSSKAFCGHVWIKTQNPGIVGGQLRVQLSDNAGNGAAFVDLDVTATWQRIPFSVTLGAGAAGTVVRFQLQRAAGGQLGTFCYAGAQVTPDWLTPSMYDYQTNGSGVVVPINPRTGRRQGFFSLPFNSGWLTVEVPASQTTDDGASFYSTGVAFPVSALTRFTGTDDYPWSASMVQPEYRLDFPYGGSRHYIAGDRKQIIDVQTTFTSYENEDAVETLLGVGTDDPFLFYEGGEVPGGAVGTNDPSLFSLFRLTSESRINYLIPEVIDFSATFEEVI